MKNKYVGIYHSADADGWACAAIYKHKFNDDIEVIGYNYGQSIEEILEKAKGKIVFIADVTFTYENMLKLSEVCDKLFIYDHHETFYKEWLTKSECQVFIWGDSSLEWTSLNNINFYYKKGIAGCEVLWKKLYYNKPMPLVIHYIGMYDTNREGVFTDNPTGLGVNVLEFTYGLREVKYADKIDKILDCIESSEIFESIFANGATVKRYSDAQNERVEYLGTEIRVWHFLVSENPETLHRKFASWCIAATNTTIDPSQFRPKGTYDFIVNYYKAKDGSWKYSLRPGNNQGKNPHLGEIAALFEYNGSKGGGHKDAAGFSFHKNLFE